MEWTGARYADGPTAEAEAWIAAPPERVWPLVSDVRAMPELSDELYAAEWLDGAGPVPTSGARFRGYSRHPELGEWSTVSYVVECAEPRVFAWAVEDPEVPSALWRFALEERDGGTLLRERVRLGPGRSGLSYAIDRMPEKEQKIVYVRMRELESAAAQTVARVKCRVEDA